MKTEIETTITPISTDAHFQSWMTAPEDRRAAAHEALIGASTEQQAEIGGTMTISTAADRSTISRPTVYRAIRAGALVAAPLYPGGNPRIRESDFRRWIQHRGNKA
jgi:excisionase family DNA binding protein